LASLAYFTGANLSLKKVDVNIGIFKPAEPHDPWDDCQINDVKLVVNLVIQEEIQ